MSPEDWTRQFEYPSGFFVACASMTLVACSAVGYITLKILEPSSPPAANILYKFRLYRKYMGYFIFSKDKSYTVIAPSQIEKETTRKTIVFVRHGESEWNLVFNKGFGPSFIVRLLSAIIREISLLPTRDSIFIDSSLSEEGVEQAKALRGFLSSSGLPSMLTDSSNSVMVSSNLRRAIETGTIAFQNRLTSTSEKVTILSSLQEMSRNVDANALAEAGKIPDLGVVLRNVDAKTFDPTATYDASENHGQKSLKSNGQIRMKEFCDWALHKQQATTIVVAAGHSLWFRNFFRAYLPSSFEYVGKKKKIVNCGIVSFDLLEDENGTVMIDSATLKVQHGGFDGETGIKSE